MERIEDLQFAVLRFLQNDRVFPFGTDAVLLASFCRAGAKDTVVDLGTGSGILPILLYGRTRARIIGIEIQEEAAALAKRNVALNHAQDRISILQGDLREAPALIRERVSVVVCNPPYDKLGTGGVSQRDAHRVARHEVACSLEDVVKSAAGLLQTGGNFYLIHRASRLAELCDVLRRHRLRRKRQHRRETLWRKLLHNPVAPIVGETLYAVGFSAEYAVVRTGRRLQHGFQRLLQTVGELLKNIASMAFPGAAQLLPSHWRSPLRL